MKNKLLIFIFTAAFNMLPVQAQFTITNSLRTKDATGLKIGDAATLTAGTGADPDGNGWLRLTSATANQKGYMYVTSTFPTTSGVVADFEYKTWRSTSDSYFGADGFSVFLFDGAVTESNFKLGGYGGSLGYASYSNPLTAGLTGGYIGIGMDEFGNFAAPVEGRTGGPGVVANAVVLRGPTQTTNSNPYLAHAALGDQTGGIVAVRQRDGIDYNTLTSTRPADNIFYRRVQIYVVKNGANYDITVKWRKQGETIFTNIMTYTMNGTTYPIPPTMRLGFAASTGGGFNFHEVRNILLTTPGNIRVDSRSNSAVLCNDKETAVTFNIEVTNDSTFDLTKINFTNEIQDATQNLLDITKFKITGITTTGFTSTTLPTSTFTSNRITGTVGLAKKSSGIVTITGNYYKRSVPTNQNLNSYSTVESTETTDTDITNNNANTKVFVRKCNIITNPSLPSYSK